MEQVALRNIRVAENNTMITADHKVDDILDVSSYKGINFEDVAAKLFAQRNIEAPAEGETKEDTEFGVNLGADIKIFDLYKVQEEFISL